MSTTLPESLNVVGCYRQMQASHPVTWDEDLHAWLVFRASDVARVLTDHQTFSAAVPLDLPPMLMTMDPPEQQVYRRLVAPAFTPKAIGKLTPRIEARAKALLAPLLEAGAWDMITGFAEPFSLGMIGDLLGLPEGDEPRLQRWSNAFASGASSEALQQLPELEATTTYLAKIISEKQARPQQDLISLLLSSRIDGRPLGSEELLGMCGLLLTAGVLNTTQLIAWSCFLLAQSPSLYARLFQEPSQRKGFIEEVLRTHATFPRCLRITTTQVDLGGQTIPPGQAVMAVLAAANYDPALCEQPERFDLQRCPNQHMTFGAGAHSCLGTHLARVEARIALSLLIEQIAALRLSPDISLEPIGQGFIHGFAHLPMTVVPRHQAASMGPGSMP